MLKRQRPATPPIPTLPLLEEPSSLDAMVMEREYKRRRTASITPLDDHWKGRPSSPRSIVSQSGNSKEDTEISVDSQYKSANSILRELHTLHQHKLLFSGALQNHSIPFQSTLIPSSHWKSNDSSSLERCKQTRSEAESSSRDEQNQVKERYEDTNRLLGSMLLSRRKQLGLE